MKQKLQQISVMVSAMVGLKNVNLANSQHVGDVLFPLIICSRYICINCVWGTATTVDCLPTCMSDQSKILGQKSNLRNKANQEYLVVDIFCFIGFVVKIMRQCRDYLVFLVLFIFNV